WRAKIFGQAGFVPCLAIGAEGFHGGGIVIAVVDGKGTTDHPHQARPDPVGGIGGGRACGACPEGLRTGLSIAAGLRQRGGEEQAQARQAKARKHCNSPAAQDHASSWHGKAGRDMHQPLFISSSQWRRQKTTYFSLPPTSTCAPSRTILPLAS